MVHAHFKHAKAAASGQPRQAERDADMVVVTAHTAMARSTTRPVQSSKNCFFHAGFANRSGHRDPFGSAAFARGMGQIMQRLGRIFDQNMRIIDRAIDNRCRRAILKRFVEEAMAVHGIAF